MEAEFESIFVATVLKNNNTIICEFYHIPNTDEKLSLQKYQAIIEKKMIE